MRQSNAREKEPESVEPSDLDLSNTDKLAMVRLLKAYAGTDPRVTDPATIQVNLFTEEDVLPVFPKRTEVNVKFTPQLVAHILNNISNTGVTYSSCDAAGVRYGQFCKLRKEFPGLNDLIDEAMAVYVEKIQHTVHSRAVEGWLEPVYYKGEHAGFVRKFSDRLLELHAKRHDPAYRDKQQLDVNVAGGVLLISPPAQDKEAWLEEQRKKNAIPAEVVK